MSFSIPPDTAPSSGGKTRNILPYACNHQALSTEGTSETHFARRVTTFTIYPVTISHHCARAHRRHIICRWWWCMVKIQFLHTKCNILSPEDSELNIVPKDVEQTWHSRCTRCSETGDWCGFSQHTSCPPILRFASKDSPWRIITPARQSDRREPLQRTPRALRHPSSYHIFCFVLSNGTWAPPNEQSPYILLFITVLLQVKIYEMWKARIPRNEGNGEDSFSEKPPGPPGRKSNLSGEDLTRKKGKEMWYDGWIMGL